MGLYTPIVNYSRHRVLTVFKRHTVANNTRYINILGENRWGSVIFYSVNTKNRGVDISHRGGLPGFIHIENDNRLLIPDYSDNHFFNTLGNLAANPKAGLLFIDDK